MRVAIVTPFFSFGPTTDGGVATHYGHLVAALSPLVAQITVLTPVSAQRKLEIPPTLTNVTVRTFSADPSVTITGRSSVWRRALVRCLPERLRGQHRNVIYTFRVALLLAKLQRQHLVDLVETTNYNYSCLLYSFLPWHRPIVTRVSTTARQQLAHASPSVSPRRSPKAYFEDLQLRRSRAVVTHTRSHACEVACELKVSPSEFHLIPHGIAVPLTPEPYPPDSELCILFVGLLCHRKGIDVLLDAVPTLLTRFPSLRIRIVGHDPANRFAKKLADKHPESLLNRISFLGTISSSELEIEYARCHLLVVPSRYESFGLVYVEAMAYGRVPVGTWAGGIPEVITHGKSGILVEPGNADALSTALTQLLADRELRCSLAISAHNSAREQFDRGVMAQRTLALYESLLPKH